VDEFDQFVSRQSAVEIGAIDFATVLDYASLARKISSSSSEGECERFLRRGRQIEFSTNPDPGA